ELQQAASISPSFYGSYEYVGVLNLDSARRKVQLGQTPEEDLKAARDALDKSIKLNNGEGELYRWMAETFLCEAGWLSPQDKKWPVAVKNGIELCNKSLELDPQNASALAVQGLLYNLLASKDHTVESAAAGRKFLQQAVQLNPFLRREYNIPDRP